MKVKCEYCDSYIDENEEFCPQCGAVNAQYNREGTKVPKTIEQLKQWYTDHNLLPEETTRFFIGVDYKEPKAFGIFKNDEGEFVVYKNKADGQRAVRYKGKDEAYAVNELYSKLKEEIQSQKSANEYKGAKESGGNASKYSKTDLVKAWLTVIAIAIIVIIPILIVPVAVGGIFAYLIYKFVPGVKDKWTFSHGFIAATIIGIALSIGGFAILSMQSRYDGYYYIDDELYNKRGDDWYIYDDGDYSYTYAPITSDEYDEYRIDDSYVDNDDKFENSRFYEENFSSDYSSDDSSWDSWDSGSSWDSSDSWDSGSSDWDSDW